MKRISLILLTLVAHAAIAQSTPSQAPPKLEKIEEVAEDPITVTAKPGTEGKITERRDNSGNVTETTVKSGPSTYTLRPNHPAGTALPGDAMSGSPRGAQWTVLEFDIGKKKKKTTDDEAVQDNAPPPPAPTVK
ncbi:hypothetical protein GTP46_03095 [Duganella sp. FT135W]|uniref:DUF2782 domain-containing protein n=1 Tax=Duganella flavida TaxID=2692175 RepID=A0A6L8K6X1_9BURK|nr:hypothetical protein [Duganella flavida]MYM21634.1 hypothetical protein [Duganella flavida]